MDKQLVENIKFKVGNSTIGVRVADTEYLFNKGSGELYSINKNGKQYLKTQLRLNFWKAPIDNDRANGLTNEWAKWKIASLYYFTKKVDMNENKLLMEYGFPMCNDKCFVEYSFNVDGSCNVNYRLECENENDSLPNFGFIFKMDKTFSKHKWYGNVALESTSDRKNSSKICIGENEVLDNYIGYLKPQDCGNKTDIRYIALSNTKGEELKISSSTSFETSVLPYTPHELENAKNTCELPDYDSTVVTANVFKTGVGGNDSWGSRPYKEYILRGGKKLEFRVVIEVV